MFHRGKKKKKKELWTSKINQVNKHNTLFKLTVESIHFYHFFFFPFLFELFWKNSSYVSGVSVCIFAALWLCMFRCLLQEPIRLKVLWVDAQEPMRSWHLLNNIFTCKLCAWVIFIILFTGLLCDNWNYLTYGPRNGQSPILSRANCVILHLMLAFHR